MGRHFGRLGTVAANQIQLELAKFPHGNLHVGEPAETGAAGRPGTRPATMGSVQVVVLADTHAPRRWRVCPPRVAEHLRTAEHILHAGDVCTAGVCHGGTPRTCSGGSTCEPSDGLCCGSNHCN